MSHHDHLESQRQQHDDDDNPEGNKRENFPLVLHAMLEEAEARGNAHIVSWQPHGRCFVVHKRKTFVSEIIPIYFRMSKFASFQRQVNLYGFRRVTKGHDKGGYYHEMFLRGRRDLCEKIQRRQIKGTGKRKPDAPESEPNFYQMEGMPDPANTSTTASLLADSKMPSVIGMPRNAISNSTATDVAAFSSFHLPNIMTPPPSMAASRMMASSVAATMYPSMFMASSSLSSSAMDSQRQLLLQQLQQQQQNFQQQQQQQHQMNAMSTFSNEHPSLEWLSAALRAASGNTGPHGLPSSPTNSASSMTQSLQQRWPAAASLANASTFLPSTTGNMSQNAMPFLGPGDVTNNMTTSNITQSEFTLADVAGGDLLSQLGRQRGESMESQAIDNYLAALQLEAKEASTVGEGGSCGSTGLQSSSSGGEIQTDPT